MTKVPVTPGELKDKLWSRLEQLSAYGRIPSIGLFRRSFSDEESEAMTLVASFMREAGMQAGRDAAGNVAGVLKGTDSSLRPIAAGSHLDSVKNGGNFDGPLGTLGAVTAVEYLHKKYGRPKRTVEVIGFTGEEGSRYAGGFTGSLGATGRIGPEQLLKVDDDGVAMGKAMERQGIVPGRVNHAQRDWAAYLELHIEQGGVLDKKQIPIGVVRAIVGIIQARVTVRGRADHAGTTPMDMRHDAMRAAAEMIVNASQMVDEAGAPFVVTTGRMSVKPGATNIVAEEVVFTFDLRHDDSEQLHIMAKKLQAMCEKIAEQREVSIAWALQNDVLPVASDSGLKAKIVESAEELGLTWLDMVSGAGHDAQIVAAICPVAMLFVPSRDGRSHTPDEYTSPEECANGAAVLAGALKRLAWD